ncbi:MAG TPA: ABC transporter permease [Actinophytocola sp.]|uniref:ABC transporter permease n=1 Tax=Actinophytocola sp. TaxID=1872138 RepID=UPI002DBDD85D|nr:ABC transporter permease [Actinophytocola sp.]HEU5471401.1 ABC transporter permease [Actinophytocola sp.]
MTALTIMATGLRRLARDRTALFFMVLLPIVIILVIGATVRDTGEIRIGVVAAERTPLATELVTDLRQSPAVSVTDYAGESEARNALRRNELDAVLIVPAGLDGTLRSGGTVTIPLLGSAAQSIQQAARSAVSGLVARHAARVEAARFTVDNLGGTFDERLATATRLQASVGTVTVRTETVDATSDYLPLGFSYSAPTMLVLFVFINALAGGAAIIESRRLGIYDRVCAAPIRPHDIVFGETLTYLAVALLQSLLIVGIGAVLFGVRWGDPLAAAALITVWALVGTGTGILAGTLFRTPEQAGAIGPAIGIACGMLGGAMWPLEIVPQTMRTIGHITPHAWAIDGWIEILSRGGGIPQIATQLTVLAAVALTLLTIASIRLGRRLTA